MATFDEGGKLIEVKAYIYDITDRKRAEEALRKISEKTKLFAYSVAHDLKSPVTGIYGLVKRFHQVYADVLGEKGKTYCDQILKAAEHLSELVAQINVYIATGAATAACLWIAAAIGMASGAGLYTIAAVTTLLALFSLVLLRGLEGFYRKDVYRDLEVTVPNEVDMRRVTEAVKNDEVMITFFGLERDYETQVTTARMSLRLFHKGDAENLSHLIINRLEETHIPLKAIRWLRP